jgi:hypothetical protein
MASTSMRVRVKKIGNVQEFGANGFKKRELIGVIDGEYPQEFPFEFINDKTSLLDSVLEDSYVTIHYNLRCRKVEKQGKDDMYFLSLSGWKIEV